MKEINIELKQNYVIFFLQNYVYCDGNCDEE